MGETKHNRAPRGRDEKETEMNAMNPLSKNEDLMALAQRAVNVDDPAGAMLAEMECRMLMTQLAEQRRVIENRAKSEAEKEKMRKAAAKATKEAIATATALLAKDRAGILSNLSLVRTQLKAHFVERSAPIDGALTALVAREHMLTLGPPGTAKTELAETLSACIDFSTFEIQLTKDTSPEEVFGIFSAQKMMNEDRYERCVDGVAPVKQVWILDEIFKAGSALLNGFLLAIQQRKMRNGAEMIDLVLETVFGMSNEYPEDPSLDALYDRFTLRYWVESIGDQNALLGLLTTGTPEVTAKLSRCELEALRIMADQIPWGVDEAKILLSIKSAIENAGFAGSDRTWIGKASKLVRARAVVNGHDRVQPNDFLVLADTLWKIHTERPALLKVVGNAADPYGAQAASIIDGVRIAMKKLPSVDDIKVGTLSKPGAAKEMGEIQAKLGGLRDSILDVAEKSADNDSVKEAVEVVETALKQLAKRGQEITLYRPVVG